MKFVLLSVLVFVFSTAALAQKHMVDLNSDGVNLGILGLNKEKQREQNVDETRTLGLAANYMYAVLPQLQVGAEVAYFNIRGGNPRSKIEAYSFLPGVIFNLDSDLANSFYTSVFAGWSWNHDLTNTIVRSETFESKVAFGKRFNLTDWKIANISYSPDIEYTVTNPTTRDSSTEWEQDLTFNFFKFSVLF